MTTNLDAPAFTVPALRTAVGNVLKTTDLVDALAHNDIAELITELIEAYFTAGIVRVLVDYAVDPDLVDSLATQVDDAITDAACNL